MRLTDLEPEFLKRVTNTSWHYVQTLAEADGLMFLCPKCFLEKRGPIGCHRCICWFTGRVPDDCHPGPGRWNPVGDFTNMTFVGPGSTSVMNETGCKAHFLVQGGEVHVLPS